MDGEILRTLANVAHVFGQIVAGITACLPKLNGHVPALQRLSADVSTAFV